MIERENRKGVRKLIYNKLVRDRIPEIIADSGKKPVISKLNKQEYTEAARTKLSEELSEYTNARNDEEAVEELADLMELIYALSSIHGASPEKLEQVRKTKADNRGGFRERIYLKEVTE
ncbi:nucleoside triphosphate pyrophosphohydrolase [Alteribacter natronophilus]|uniref:nucleoside triphosphate pyrophosphohydrolase n=1 Tax=Alteribacter natronophilus TaxID=2583810 RepID=UPI00110ED549|nr:nucleoside triphosphate pyrophosphohydrolase [Alteribacter natronophilus]TMW70653.1 phosphoribosyl-ATP pyrophosphohydrolase [Alteribacter natronophilus]